MLSKTTAPRALAHWLLRQVAQHAPEASREWAAAMQGELKFIEGDWAALAWALGSVAAVIRHAGRGWLSKQADKLEQWREQAMEQIGKKAGLLIAGAVAAVALSLTAFGLEYWAGTTFPQLGLLGKLPHILMVVVIPGILSVSCAIWLWRRKRPVALGILLSTAIMVAHIVVFFAMHGHHH